MKKTIILSFCLMLIGGNAFGAGDLVVNGNLGVGTGGASTTAKIDVSATDIRNSLRSVLTDTTGNIARRSVNGSLNVTAEGMSNFMIGGDYTIAVPGASNSNNATWSGITGPLSQKNQIQFFNDTYGGTYTIDADVIGTTFSINRGFNNVRNYNLNNVIFARMGYDDSGGGSGLVAINNGYGIKVEQWSNTSGMTISNAYGIYLGNQSGSTSSYGIVLDGDGAGSDIVFGPSQEARIYSSGGELFAEDGASNVTQISPHDPETGEWIFYSRNTKTGKVVRIEMEKLVKAVERLTGEKFMVESLMETK